MTLKIASIENRYWLDHNLNYVPSWSTPGNARRGAKRLRLDRLSAWTDQYKMRLDHLKVVRIINPDNFCYHYVLGMFAPNGKLVLLNNEKELNSYTCEVC